MPHLRSITSTEHGRAYFISQGEPVVLWDFLGRILKGLDLPPPRRRVSHGAAHAVGLVLETIYKLLARNREPPMTRFVAAQLAQSHHFSIAAARRDLDYAPSITTDEVLRRVVDSIRSDHDDSVGS